MQAPHLYAELAALFRYPGEDYHLLAGRCRLAVPSAQHAVLREFGKFQDEIAGLTCEELQEMFTRTFDLNPLCTLEIGWQLFGEDYERGAFLVKMRQQLREHGIPENGELPDHLSHALALLAGLEPEEAEEFARRYVLPAMDKMRTAWKESRNVYAGLLETTFELLKIRFPYDPSRTLAPIPQLRVLQ